MLRVCVRKEFVGTSGPFSLAVDLAIPTGQFAVVYGPSGAGKTTLLRLVCGLSEPTSGTVAWGSDLWSIDGRLRVAAAGRDVSLVSREMLLFANMNVRKNVAYALPPAAPASEAELWLSRVGATDLADQYPDSLSGGERQRVLLARALARRPRLLLLDEPFSALDHRARVDLQDFLHAEHRARGLTTVLVSHDLGEVCRLGDHAFLLEAGRVTRSGRPVDLFAAEAPEGCWRLYGQLVAFDASTSTCRMTAAVGGELRTFTAAHCPSGLKVGDRIVIDTSPQGTCVTRLLD